MTGGVLSPKGLRCLQNLAVAGASSVAELDALDPTAPDHAATIKGLYQQGYVASNATTRLAGDPARYSLTDKARSKLAADKTTPATDPDDKPVNRARTYRTRYANAPKGGNVAGPVRYGSMSTAGLYNPCKDMLAPATRPGAEVALTIPSRCGDRLHYRDGRVAFITPSLTS